MGLLGRLTGWDQYNEAFNAVMASHLIDTADADLRQKIAKQIVDLLLMKMTGTTEGLLADLSREPRIVQMQFVALACNSLGIAPNIPNMCFSKVLSPYRAEGSATEDDFASVVRFLQKVRGVRINWPGDSVKVDFIKLYNHG
jgi:hypothetical protein